MTGFRSRPDGSAYPIGEGESELDVAIECVVNEPKIDPTMCVLCGNPILDPEHSYPALTGNGNICEECAKKIIEENLGTDALEIPNVPSAVQSRSSQPRILTCSRCNAQVPYGSMGEHFRQSHPEEAV